MFQSAIQNKEYLFDNLDMRPFYSHIMGQLWPKLSLSTDSINDGHSGSHKALLFMCFR
jgi:hypothetical protein